MTPVKDACIGKRDPMKDELFYNVFPAMDEDIQRTARRMSLVYNQSPMKDEYRGQPDPTKDDLLYNVFPMKDEYRG